MNLCANDEVTEYGRNGIWARSLSIKTPDRERGAEKEKHPGKGELVKMMLQREKHNKNYLSQS